MLASPTSKLSSRQAWPQVALNKSGMHMHMHRVYMHMCEWGVAKDAQKQSEPSEGEAKSMS